MWGIVRERRINAGQRELVNALRELARSDPAALERILARLK
jgi:hypothetical protein